MDQRERTTRTVARRDIQEQIDDLLSQVAEGEAQISIEDEGETIAGIVSGRDLANLRRYEREIAEAEALFERLRRPFRDVDHEQIQRDVASVIQEVRREKREHDSESNHQ